MYQMNLVLATFPIPKGSVGRKLLVLEDFVLQWALSYRKSRKMSHKRFTSIYGLMIINSVSRKIVAARMLFMF